MRRFFHLASLALSLCFAVSACQKGASPEPAPQDEKAEAKPAAAPEGLVRVSLQGAKVKGSDRALVTIVEFSDYQCPFCKKAHQTIETLLGEYGDKVRLAVFDNPLPFHKRAEPVAKWAYAAGEQGKYWQARDALFEHQKTLDDDSLAALARELGLDPERLDTDRRSVGAEKHVKGGLAAAESLDVTGTPAFFVNGRRIVGAQPAAAFRAAIDQAAAQAEALVARGVRREDVYAKILEMAAPAVPRAKAAPKPGEAHGDGKPCGAGEDCGCHANDDASADSQVVDVELGAAPSRGPAAAPVTLVVFTDFECPFCKKAEETVRAMEKAYSGKLKIVYKSAPLPFHEHARLAAKAALAANRQGKFFEYRDALFEHQDALDRDALVGYAAALGLDVERFRADLDDKALDAAIDADGAQVEKLAVKGTPTFFVNGRRVIGAQPEGVFRATIDTALAAR
jgi:protein-disulfide isomerase